MAAGIWSVALLMVLFFNGISGQQTEIEFVDVNNINEDGGVTQVCIRIENAGASPVETTVNIVASGTAGPNDFSPNATTLVFTQQEVQLLSQKCFNVIIEDDDIVESSEMIIYEVNSTNPTDVTTLNQESFTINDNDLASVAVSNETTMTFVEDSADSLTVCLTLTGPAGGLDIQRLIALMSTDGTAMNGQDFIFPAGTTVTFPRGAVVGDEACESFEIDSNSLVQSDRDFVLSIMTNVAVYIIESPNNTTITIVDNDFALLTLSSLSTEFVEGTDFIVCVNTNAEATVDIRVDIIISGDVDGGDFTDLAFSIIIQSNRDRVCEFVTPAADQLFEGPEVFNLTINGSEPSDFTILGPTISFTLTDADIANISFDLASDSFDEGGTQDNPICLSITGIPTNGIAVPIFVNVSIMNSTTERCNVQGNARTDIDFNISLETLTFDNTTTSQCFTFSLMDDNFAEDDETVAFEVSSTTPSNVMRVDNITTEITIIDNEDNIQFSLLPSSQVLENAGFFDVSVRLSGLSDALERDINITLSDIQDSATNPDDYFISADLVQFLCTENISLSGNEEKIFTVNIVNDTIFEGDEIFNLSIQATPSNRLTIGDNSTVTILDDEFNVGFTITMMIVNETVGTTVELEFAVSDGVPRRETMFTVSVGDENTALLDADYSMLSSNFTLGPDKLQEIVNVTIIDDDLTEMDELLQIIVTSNDNSAFIINSTINVTIDSEDESSISLTNSSNSFLENGTIQVCLVVSGAELGSNLTVTLSTMNMQAVIGDDFETSSLMVDIAASNNETCVNVSGLEDNVFDGFEDFEIFIESDNLEDVVPGATSTLTLTVININELIILIESSTSSIPEVGGRANLTATVGPTSSDSIISFSISLDLSMSTAILDMDYNLTSTVFMFQASVANDFTIIEVASIDDLLLEGDEFIFFSIVDDLNSTLPGLTINVMNNNVTIEDNEVVSIEFSESVYNASEADGSIPVCLAPVTIDTIGFSIPIDVSVSLINDTVDQEDCSGSGNLSMSDFVISDTTMFTFPANSSTPQCFTFNITDDDRVEVIETASFQITVLTTTDLVTAGAPTVINITDNDIANIGLTVGELSINEDDGFATVCSLLSVGQLCANALLNIDTGNISSPMDFAIAGEDFTIDPMMIMYPANSSVGTSVCFNITVIDDIDIEPDNEFFNVSIVYFDEFPMIQISENTSTVVSIVNNDANVRFTNQSFTVGEGEVGTVCIEIFEGQLLEPAVTDINVTTVTSNTSDFMLSVTSLTLSQSVLTACTAYNITNDLIKEENELFSLQLTSMANTIVIPEPMLNITIMSADIASVFISNTTITVSETVFEFDFCIELSGASLSESLDVSVTATDGDLAKVGSDYTIPTSSVTFDANSLIGTQQCLTVRILDDDAFEGTHNFTISLDDPGTPLCQLGFPSELSIVILDNENVTVSLDVDFDIIEGQTGEINVTLSDIPLDGIEIDVQVDLLTTLLTAEDGDFTLSPDNQSVVFPAGTFLRTTLALVVNATEDNAIELDMEQFRIDIDTSNIIYAVGDPSVTVSIISLDSAIISFEVGSNQVNESLGMYMACLQFAFNGSANVLEDDLNITLGFMNGTAFETADFLEPTEPATFLGNNSVSTGSTTCALVTIVDDDVYEATEEIFTLVIANFSISTTVTGTITSQSVTIEDDEFAEVTVAMLSVDVLEDAGFVEVCARLTGPLGGTAVSLQVGAETSDVTAIGNPITGGDYIELPSNASILFQPGDVLSVACTNISISDDEIIEGNENFNVTIDDFDNSRIRINNSVTVVNIIDNDLRILFLNESINVAFPEMDAPTFTVCFNVSQGIPTFDNEIFLTADPSSTAVIGSDYLFIGSPVILNSTVISGCIDVEILDDNFLENDDFVSFFLNTTSPGLQIDNGFLNLTIENDDIVQFEFTNTKYVVNESVNIAEICVRTVPGGAEVGPDIPISFDLIFNDKTANGSDFTVSHFERNLMFTASRQVDCAMVTINDDGIVESSEYFKVEFEFEGTTTEVDVVIYDPDVCPNVESGTVCNDSVFLRVCNTLRRMNGGVVPRSCDVVLEEYTDISVQNTFVPLWP